MMGKSRLEAFSDGVLAVVITIMVLELKVPHGTDLSALMPLVPVFLSYVLSFVMVGIYWNNHHHVWQTARTVNGTVLWANMHLLFWISLIPFVTGWMGENHFASVPAALFGVVALMAAVAYTVLTRSIIALHGNDSPLAKAIGGDTKGWISLGLYAAAIPAAFYDGVVSFGIYVLVAMIWFIPDTRIERTISKN